jgi:hypothetical protein
MASSSSSWVLILILLVVGAVAILCMNEANYGYFKSGGSLTEEGGKYLNKFVGKFSTSKEEPTAVPPAKPKAKAKIAVKDSQKDDLGRRDRAELGELLDKVGQ